MEPVKLGLAHVQLAAPAGCEAAARHFYGSLLRLAEVPKPAALEGRGGVWFALDDGRELHIGVDETFLPAHKAHPAFRTDSIGELAEYLQEAGWSVQWDDGLPDLRRFYVDDPWGNRLEIVGI